MDQSITSGECSSNIQIRTINNNYYNKQFSYDLTQDSSRKKFFQKCVYEIINTEKIEIISLNQLKTKLAIKLMENSSNSDDNILLADILPKFNEFLNSEVFKKEEGYKISIL